MKAPLESRRNEKSGSELRDERMRHTIHYRTSYCVHDDEVDDDGDILHVDHLKIDQLTRR